MMHGVRSNSKSNQRRANLVGNYGPLEFGTSPEHPETYPLARSRKAPPARTTYGGNGTVRKYPAHPDFGKRRPVGITPQLDDIVFEEADKITYEEPSHDDDESESNGGLEYENSFPEVQMEYHEPNVLYSLGSSCSGGAGGSSRRRKSNPDPQRAQSGNSGNYINAIAKSRGRKMYELDPGLFPQAAAARAAYENRLRKKRENEQLITDLEFYRSGYERLSLENQQLKEELYEIRFNTNATEWYKFFRAAGITHGSDIEYASIFEEQRMKPNMLEDFNENLLRKIGITAMGDILLIIKHAKFVFNQTKGHGLVVKPSALHLPKVELPSTKDKNIGDSLIITSVRSLKAE